MSDSRHERASEIFFAARDLSADERAAFVSRECGEDEELSALVERLLRGDRSSSSLDKPALQQFETLVGEAREAGALPPATEDIAGRQIGAYRLIRELGRGGMGTVYLAARAEDTIAKEVAIKLVAPGQASPEVVRRFVAERQILARLDHPNVARFLDAGSTDDGLPYVVMEYVEGEPIRDYCDRVRLSTAKRLELFRSLCSAVQYAHQNLVVHRDLKPGNVLVTADGVPKLLDFGIAKLLSQDDAAPVAETRASVRLLTPLYASPEQVRGEPVTTASDVYSLGLLLYELLTGRRPFRLRSASLTEIEHAICELDPERPSASVLRAADGEESSAEELSHARQTQPARLRRELAGDLDNIVLVALRKEPARRYASAGELSEDVRRYLAGLPVQARADTWRYRSTKFVHRNRVSVAVAAAFVAVLAGFSVHTYRQAERLDEERETAVALGNLAVAEAERVRIEAETATEVTEFLVALFRMADPRESRGAPATVRELLDSSLSQIDDLEGQPAVQSRLMDTIGRSYQYLGLNEPADALFRRAVAVREAHFGPRSVEVAESLHRLARTRLVAGDIATSLEMYERVLRIQRAKQEPTALVIAESLQNLALAHGEDGDTERARELLLAALSIAERHDDEEGRSAVGAVRFNLGWLTTTLGHYAEAAEHYRAAAVAFALVHGPTHPNTLTARRALGENLIDRGELEDAEASLEEAFESMRPFGEEMPDAQYFRRSLASVKRELAKYDEALELLEEQAQLDRREGVDALALPNTLVDLSGLLSVMGEHEAAEEMAREALAMRDEIPGQDQWFLSAALNNLALILMASKQHEEAGELLARALEIRRELYRDDHPEIAELWNNLAELERGSGRPEKAIELHRRALAIREAELGQEHPITSVSLHNLGRALREVGQYEEAEEVLQRALAIRRGTLPEGHPRLRGTEASLARVRTESSGSE